MSRRALAVVVAFGAVVRPLELPSRVFREIGSARVAVVDDFLSRDVVAELREDAAGLWEAGLFSAPTRDTGLKRRNERFVLRGSVWQDYGVGRGAARRRVADTMRAVREACARELGRVDLAVDGSRRHEFSYTRFAPGASLARHVDEHHEECKGVAGWTAPTRRSVTWLVYLNEAWTPDQGGELRAYERRAAPAPETQVGATKDGDLQVGWLRATAGDPVDRPVFLDSRRRDGRGACAFTCSLPGRPSAVVSRDFDAQPFLYVNSDAAQRILFRERDVAARFVRLEQLRTPLNPDPGFSPAEYAHRDVAPTAGRLVMYDSVAVPHEVLPVGGVAPRFALAGWFHQDQQPLHHPYSEVRDAY